MKKLSDLPPEVAAEIKRKYGLDKPYTPSAPVLVKPDAPCGPVDELPVVPFVGIGPLKLGMTPEEMAEAIGRLCAGWAGPGAGVRVSQVTTAPEGESSFHYMGTGEGCDVVFRASFRNGRTVDLMIDREVRSHASVTLGGMDLFRMEAASLIAALRDRSAMTCDMEDEDLSYWYWFRDIGLYLGREGVFHPKLLADKAYVEEMGPLIEEERRYLYFGFVRVAEQGRELL